MAAGFSFRYVEYTIDGDGVTDLVVSGQGPGIPKLWYILRSSTGFTSALRIGWGNPGDVPVPKRS